MTKQEKLRLAIIDATLSLAAEKDWDELTLQQIAREAKASLSTLRREFGSKAHILAAFIRHIDDEVLDKFDEVSAEDTAKERLFDVIMTRFEVMDAYKPGLKNLYRQRGRVPGLAAGLFRNLLSSHYWMLNASGISAEGPEGFVRVSGLLGLYAKVFPIWLEDEDAGLAKTMAALDRRLGRAESWAKRVDGITNNTMRLFCSIVPFSPFGCKKRKRAAADEPPPDTDISEEVRV